VQVFKPLRKRVHEIFGSHEVLGVASVHHPPREDGTLAEVFAAGTAELADSARPVQPGNADARPRWESGGAGSMGFHHSDYLVAWNYGRFLGRQFAFGHVQVGAAHSAGMDPDEHLAGPGAGLRQISDFERVGFNGGGRSKHAGLHVFILPRDAASYNGTAVWVRES
jgi:hypothetical protein